MLNTSNGTQSMQERSPAPQLMSPDPHSMKIARMEATARQGYCGGIPAKIEEGIEPIDETEQL